MDMNDRQLRFIVNGLNGRVNGVPREDGYDITLPQKLWLFYVWQTILMI